MRQRYYNHIKNQPKVKVIARTQENTMEKIKWGMFAVVSAGIFYLFGYNLWYALMAG